MSALRLAGALVALVLVIPVAAAAPVEGRLEVSSFWTEELLQFRAPFGADVVWNATDVPELDLEAQAVTVTRLATTRVQTEGPLPSAGFSNDERQEVVQHENARITIRAGDGAQLVVLRGHEPIEGTAQGASVKGVTSVLLFSTATATEPTRCQDERFCGDAYGVYELSSAKAAAPLTGELTLALRGPTLVVDAGGQTSEYRSGLHKETTGALTQSESAWVLVTIAGANGTFAATGPSLWYLAEPTLEASEVSFAQAKGALTIGALRYQARDESVQARGQMHLAPSGVTAASLWERHGATHSDEFTALVAGDVASINLRAAPVFVEAPAVTTGVVAAVLALLGGIAYYWPRIVFGFATFYTRLKKPEILDNEVRNAVFDIIRASPGISARAIHRASGQSWGTVVYHLRQLERHHLVVSRPLGRTRNYYENHGKYRGMEAQLACLQSERAVALARAVHAQPGITQEELSAATGLPQPTTSYYVRKLREAGLVQEAREGRYARYRPHDELGRYLEIAEVPSDGAPGPAEGGSAGANA